MLGVKRRRRSVDDDQTDDSTTSSQHAVYTCSSETAQWSFLCLPPELQYQVLLCLDATTLARIATVCTAFRAVDTKALLHITEKAARDILTERCGSARRGRWWRTPYLFSWTQQLLYEESSAEFDIARCTQLGFAFHPDEKRTRVNLLELTTMGPKLLVSKWSTADQPALRWHMRVMGNTALEFGVVPVGMEDQQRCLHKCLVLPSINPTERPVGFCSNITSGSQQLVKVPIGRESEVEVLATPGCVEFIITNPPTTMCARAPGNNPSATQQIPPAEQRMQIKFPKEVAMKLAATNWAYSKFEVLHQVPAPPEDLPPPKEAASTAQA